MHTICIWFLFCTATMKRYFSISKNTVLNDINSRLKSPFMCSLWIHLCCEWIHNQTCRSSLHIYWSLCPITTQQTRLYSRLHCGKHAFLLQVTMVPWVGTRSITLLLYSVSTKVLSSQKRRKTTFCPLVAVPKRFSFHLFSHECSEYFDWITWSAR